jgi:hypothetical protein
MSMWADTLFAAERAHLLSLMTWAAASVLVGTAIIAWVGAARRSTLLGNFAVQTSVWGAVELGVALLSYQRLALRDLSAATRLDRAIWLNTGLAAGCVLSALVLIAAGWKLGRRLDVVGAGIGIVVQGCALALLELLLASQISR